MSSHPKGERRPNDAYYTDDRVARAIVAEVERHRVRWRDGDSPGTILEPSVGGGAFIRACREVWPGVHDYGVDLTYTEGVALSVTPFVGDFLDFRPRHEGFDLIIGNPPYSEAEEHIRHSLTMLAQHGVCAMLLRLGFLGSLKRREFFATHQLRRVDVLRPRPSFTGGGTDSSEYAVFYWGEVPPGLGWIDWRE